LPPEESRHVLNVLRLKEGDVIALIDGQGGASVARITSIDNGVTITPDKILSSAEPKVRVILFQALCKGDKMDWVVQKAVELGACAIVPVMFARCDIRIPGNPQGRAERARRIARESAKQCGRAMIPQIYPIQTFDAMLDILRDQIVEPVCRAFVCWEESRVPFRNALAAATFESASIIIGPEGGIESGEISALASIGVTDVTLGPRILRTETAGIAALAMTLFHTGDLGC